MKMKLLLISTILLTAIACKKEGCTDPIAINYDDKADKNDNSCEYKKTTDELITEACTDFDNAFIIETPNKGTLQMTFGTDTDYEIRATGSGTELSTLWFDTSSKKYSGSMTLPLPIVVGENKFLINENPTFSLGYTDQANSVNNFSFSLIDSLFITATTADEINGQSFYYPIEATFTGKFIYWGIDANTGLSDSLICNLTGTMNLCNAIH